MLLLPRGAMSTHSWLAYRSTHPGRSIDPAPQPSRAQAWIMNDRVVVRWAAARARTRALTASACSTCDQHTTRLSFQDAATRSSARIQDQNMLRKNKKRISLPTHRLICSASLKSPSVGTTRRNAQIEKKDSTTAVHHLSAANREKRWLP
jgi:hypothetical protein